MRPNSTLVESAHPEPQLMRTVGSHWRNFALFLTLLLLTFFLPLFRLGQYSFASGSLYSHILLIPFVSAYLIWCRRSSFPEQRRGAVPIVVMFAFLGACLLLVRFALFRESREISLNDYLSLTIGSFYLFLLSGTVFSFGERFCRHIFFPLAFLAFIIPFPESVTTALENTSKQASAATYEGLMNLVGATYYRSGFVFSLPGLTIEVAQECSGIRSSLVLFITSLIAGYLFLEKGRNRAALALLVLPLGVLRNAFRILVLSLLTVHWDPGIINSPLHHQGGPLFFALSLLPFFLTLFLLCRLEKTRQSARPPNYV